MLRTNPCLIAWIQQPIAIEMGCVNSPKKGGNHAKSPYPRFPLACVCEPCHTVDNDKDCKDRQTLWKRISRQISILVGDV